MVHIKSNIEEWKAIECYESVYEVSSFGRIRSIERTVLTSANVLRKYESRLIRPSKNSGKYLTVRLSKDGNVKTFSVHRLVAEAFIINRYNKEAVNHIDGNKNNNHVGNLEWVNFKENITHAEKNQLFKLKYTDEIIEKVRNMYKTGKYTYIELSELLGISRSYIGKIVNKDNRKYSKLESEVR